jgi:hypothetical protein
MADSHRRALIERVLEGPGRASTDQRRAAFANHGLPGPAGRLLDTVAKHAYKVTDEAVAAARESLSDDQIFELVVCAAVGQASRQLDSALVALDAAGKE